MLFDSHIHTTFSTDSKMKIEDAIKKSSQNNIGLIITEHLDYKYPKENLFIFDVDKYFESYLPLRSASLYLGVEMGMRTDCLEKNVKTVSDHEFDFVLGSVHLVDGIDLFLPSYYEAKTKQQAYERYLEYIYECLRVYDFIDSLGHIDYIARYSPYQDKEFYYSQYSEVIDSILKILAENGKSIEINTRRFENPSSVTNLIPLYKKFRELGGKTVTIGSDAHNVQTVSKDLDKALYIAQECGLKPVYYKNRTPFYCF